MKLLSFELQEFKSFAANQTFDVAGRPPGLYYLTGKNKTEPELQANGTGKSTLLEAPFWGAFGRTSRGLKAGAVRSWKGKGPCAVISTWEVAAGTLDVLRTWNPNALEVSLNGDEPHPVDQQALEKELGITPHVYLSAVYFAQFVPAFVDLPPAEQSAIFTDVLGLGRWERASDRAGALVTQLETALADLNNQLAHARGEAEELLRNDFESMEAEWAQAHDDVLYDVKTRAEKASVAYKDAKKQLELARRGSFKFRKLSETADAAERTIGAHDRTVRLLAAEMAGLEKKDYKTCPTCGGPVSNKHIATELARCKKEHAQAMLLLRAAKKEHESIVTDLNKYKGDEQRLLAAERAEATALAKYDAVESELQATVDETNPYTAAREAAEQKGNELAGLIERLENNIEQNTKEIGHHKYWVKGFKELRLTVIRESLDQLTVEANEMLFQLGLQDWEIAFDVEYETKSGTIRKNFSTFIHAPGVDGPVPWEAWSGGESQRLRLAISMGFANLVCARKGIAPNIEMWDEPSTWLSDGGIHDLLTVLAERAQRYKKVILLADHRALDFGGFAETITIVKDEHGSCIET